MRNSDGNANCDSHPYAKPDGNCDPYAKPDGNGNAYAITDGNGNCDGAFANTDGNGDAYAKPDGNCHSNVDCDRTAARFTDTAASADTAAASGQLLLQ